MLRTRKMSFELQYIYIYIYVCILKNWLSTRACVGVNENMKLLKQEEIKNVDKSVGG